MKLLVATAAVGLTLLTMSPPADAQGVPQGSYQSTCTNIRMEGDTLKATCRTKQGGSRHAEFEKPEQCNGDIVNSNGALRCHVGAAGPAGPGPRYGQAPGQAPAPGYGQAPPPSYGPGPGGRPGSRGEQAAEGWWEREHRVEQAREHYWHLSPRERDRYNDLQAEINELRQRREEIEERLHRAEREQHRILGFE
jgi:hypothetical protein